MTPAFPQNVIASEAKQSTFHGDYGLLRRYAPRNDVSLAKLPVNIEILIRFQKMRKLRTPAA
jgi:hypothetical protein